jgi:formiminotetrahydrofolate cyclodeaminase
MAEFGSQRVGEALADLASPGEPPAAGVASALTAAAAAGVVELAAALAAKRIAAQNRGTGAEAADRMRLLAQQAGKLRGRLLAAGNEDARAYARVATASEGREHARALDRASDPPLAIADGAAAVAERAAEVAGAGDWAFTADAVVAGELAAAAALGCAQLVEANLAGDPEDPRPARARAAADLAARASRTAADRTAPASHTAADSRED